MDEKRKAKYKLRARIIKAMAHPTRLFIIDTLSKGRTCVCKLTEMIGDDNSTTSKHLAVLRSAGIVRDEKEGAKVLYSLKVPCVVKFFDCVEAVVKSNVMEQLELTE